MAWLARQLAAGLSPCLVRVCPNPLARRDNQSSGRRAHRGAGEDGNSNGRQQAYRAYDRSACDLAAASLGRAPPADEPEEPAGCSDDDQAGENDARNHEPAAS